MSEKSEKKGIFSGIASFFFEDVEDLAKTIEQPVMTNRTEVSVSAPIEQAPKAREVLKPTFVASEGINQELYDQIWKDINETMHTPTWDKFEKMLNSFQKNSSDELNAYRSALIATVAAIDSSDNEVVSLILKDIHNTEATLDTEIKEAMGELQQKQSLLENQRKDLNSIDKQIIEKREKIATLENEIIELNKEKAGRNDGIQEQEIQLAKNKSIFDSTVTKVREDLLKKVKKVENYLGNPTINTGNKL